MPEGVPVKQHVVSQVLRRRFVDPSTGLLAVYDLIEGTERLLPPQVVGFVRGFIRRDAAEAERLWQQTERRLSKVFAAVDDHTILEEPDLLDVLRDAIAMHWARSKTLLAVFEQTWRRLRGKRREILLQDKEKLVCRL